ncbi:hypothetical protein GCM10020219_091450 [Nonomuraea dietziae]
MHPSPDAQRERRCGRWHVREVCLDLRDVVRVKVGLGGVLGLVVPGVGPRGGHQAGELTAHPACRLLHRPVLEGLEPGMGWQ